jgi:hypothetical protein
MEKDKQKRLAVSLAIGGLLLFVFYSIISYSNKVGTDTEKNRLIRVRSLEVLEKTKDLADDFLKALRIVIDTEQPGLKLRPVRGEQNLQKLIMYNRLCERKDTADFLKTQDYDFYEENVIEPARFELQQMWEESRKTYKGACDLEKPNQCYPALTQKMEELKDLRRKLDELKRQK